MSQALVAPCYGRGQSANAFGRVALVLASFFAISVVLVALASSFSEAPSRPDYLLSFDAHASPSTSHHETFQPDGVLRQQLDLSGLSKQLYAGSHVELAQRPATSLSDGLGGKNEIGAIGQTKLRNVEPVAHIKRLQNNAPEKAADGLVGKDEIGAIGQTKLRNEEPVLDIRQMEASSDAVEKGSDGMGGKDEAGVIGQAKLRNEQAAIDVKRLLRFGIITEEKSLKKMAMMAIANQEHDEELAHQVLKTIESDRAAHGNELVEQGSKSNRALDNEFPNILKPSMTT